MRFSATADGPSIEGEISGFPPRQLSSACFPFYWADGTQIPAYPFGEARGPAETGEPTPLLGQTFLSEYNYRIDAGERMLLLSGQPKHKPPAASGRN